MKLALAAFALVVCASAQFVEPAGVYRYTFPPEGVKDGFAILAKNWAEEVDPVARPDFEKTAELRISTAPGEFEPAAFVIYAGREMKGVEIVGGDLRGGTGVIPASALEFRRVVRSPERPIFTAKPVERVIHTRFMPLWDRTTIPAGEYREVWATVRTPQTAAPGLYKGAVRVTAAGTEKTVPVQLRVLSVRLREHPTKSLVLYYPFRMVPEERILRELRDVRDHGIRHICLHLAYSPIEYVPDGGSFRPEHGRARRALELARKGGFQGTMVMGTGFLNLARKLGHKDVSGRIKGKPGVKLPNGASLEGPEGRKFRRIAKAAMEGLAALQKEYPEIRIALTEMDEIFVQNQMPQYVQFTKAAKQVPGFKYYITFSTVSEEFEPLRKQLDPWVDIRCYHGYSLEWWIGRGHTWGEMEKELAVQGDTAWFYHNVRGVFYTPVWARIINGLYLWATPLDAHVVWAYQSYKNNPFDDADAETPDFGYSFPHFSDPNQLVTTRLWEAVREGFDDLRYLGTLEELIERRGAARPKEAAEARAFLAKLRGLVRNMAPPGAATASAAKAQSGDVMDLDTGMAMGTGKTGTPLEAPIIHALAERLGGKGLDVMRAEIAQHILKLQ